MCTALPMRAMTRDEANEQLLDAAKNGDIIAMQAALDTGANVNCEDGGGKTPLHWAANFNNSRAVILLLRYDANPNIADEWGRTPLHRAAFWSNTENAQLLLNHGANVVSRDAKGDTPLHDAAYGTSANIIKLLILHNKEIVITDQQTGAQHIIPGYAIRNNDNETAYDIAHPNLKYLLEDPEKTYREAFEEFRTPILKKVCGKQAMSTWLLNRETGSSMHPSFISEKCRALTTGVKK